MTFVDIIGDIVTAVRAEYDPSNLKEPYYLYGHPLEIFNILSLKERTEATKYSKYPLIALYCDIAYDVDANFKTATDVKIVIMTETSKIFTAPSRYSTTMTPILNPIYALFIKHLKRSKYLSSEDRYAHKMIEYLYWGKEEEFGNKGNIGNDALDAIIIQNLDLRIITQC